MYELLYQNFNIFLYGFGNKMKLIYKFIKYYQDKHTAESDTSLYIISCNLNNPEMSMKIIIINKIQICLNLLSIKMLILQAHEFPLCYYSI